MTHLSMDGLQCSPGLLQVVLCAFRPRRGGRGRPPDSRRDGGATKTRAIGASCVFIFVLATVPFVLAGEEAKASSPVTVVEAWQAVVDELRTRGFGEEQLPRIEDLELPVAVPARAGRRLRVSAVCWDAGRARFRLTCGGAGACLPFLVYVRAAAHARAASCRLEPQRMSNSSSSSLPHAPEPAVRAGERATAVLVAAGLRMTAAVICLDRGARGEIVRVRSPEGRIFRARVAGRALVEALETRRDQ